VSNGTSYTPYFAAATPYATGAPVAASAAAAAGPGVYPAAALAAAAPMPTAAIQYSMPTTVDNGCGQQMLLVGNGATSTGQQTDRTNDVCCAKRTHIHDLQWSGFTGGKGGQELCKRGRSRGTLNPIISVIQH